MNDAKPVLSRAAAAVFGAKVVGSGLALGCQILLARILGADSFGYYAYALACISLLLLAVTTGLDKGALRFVASYLARKEPGLLRGYVAFAHRRVLLVSIGIGIGAVALLSLCHRSLGHEFALTTLAACFLLPTRAMAEVSGACLQGLRRVVLARVVLEVGRPLMLIVGVALGYFYARDSFNAPYAMAVHVAAYVCAASLLAMFLSARIRDRIPGATRSYRKKEWSRVSWQLALIGGLHLVVLQTDVLMIGVLNDTTQSGIYGVASKVASLAVFGLMAGNAIVAPMIAELFAKEKMAKLQVLVTFAVRATSGVTLLLTVGILVFKVTILRAFGTAFVSADSALSILLVGQVVNAVMGPVGLLMTMTAHQTLAAKVIGSCALMNIVLNMALIPRWGIEGAALATTISMTTWNLILAVMSRRKLGLRSSFF